VKFGSKVILIFHRLASGKLKEAIPEILVIRRHYGHKPGAAQNPNRRNFVFLQDPTPAAAARA
jgi:hypothetical protein